MTQQRLCRRVACSVAGCALVAASALAQPAPPPDEQAHFLAGLPLEAGSGLHALSASPAGRTHAMGIAREWADLQWIRLGAMGEWATAELGPRIDTALPLVYLFSAPDFVSADVLYPSAPVYVLCGLEPIGSVPRLDALAPRALEADLDNLRSSLRSILRLSHFITKDMAIDLRRTELKGVLPLLYLFLARTQHQIVDTTLIQIDRDGGIVEYGPARLPRDAAPGVRIRFRKEGQPATRELYYVQVDLSSQSIASKPGFFTFLGALGPANGYLKAASFILHNTGFSATREFLLQHSRSILQDDSGIPFRAFAPARWDFVFFGTYVAPEAIFKGSFQADLEKAFEAAAPTRPLPFHTGYAHSREPSLMLAVSK